MVNRALHNLALLALCARSLGFTFVKYVPDNVKPRQKTLAALLAAGASAAEAARACGVSTTYVNIMLRGELFNYEVDEQRQILIGERLAQHCKRVSEQLDANLDVLVEVRDDPSAKPSDRMRAIELINASVVPKARPKQATTTKVEVQLSPEQRTAITEAMGEDDKAE